MERTGKIFLFFILFLLVLLTIGYSSCQSGNNNSEELNISVEDTTAVTHHEEERKVLTGKDIRLEKNIRYDKYLLEDEYSYKDTIRYFQWEKIQEQIAVIENAMAEEGNWGVLSNYRNMNKEAPTVANFVRNEYKMVTDQFGVERYQSAPLYSVDGDTTLLRYGRDGWIVRLPGNDTTEMVKVKGVSFKGEFLVPQRYLIPWGDSIRFDKVVAVDVTNQNISTLEKTGDTWHILSMNHATTGVHNPPYAHETPIGIFAIQEKKVKMFYTKDGSSELAGFAPYASRFTNGAYVHGIPTQYPNKSIIESSPTLGTIPRSHMCVRNASSHSKFIFEWATVKQAIVIVID